MLGRGGVRRSRVDCGRAVRAGGRRFAARPTGSARPRHRLAARCRRRRAHACASATRAAGHAHRDPARHTADAMRLRAARQRRAAPALARPARDDLSASAYRRHARRCAAVRVLAGRAPLRVPARDRSRGRDARIVAAEAHRAGADATLSPLTPTSPPRREEHTPRSPAPPPPPPPPPSPPLRANRDPPPPPPRSPSPPQGPLPPRGGVGDGHAARRPHVPLHDRAAGSPRADRARARA